MTEPKRIQQRRTKGWRKPEGAVSVSRPGKWGNPFRVGKVIILTGPKAGAAIDRAGAVSLFRSMATRSGETAERYRAQVRAELAGKDLMCFCALDQPCHADVLLELANTTKEN